MATAACHAPTRFSPRAATRRRSSLSPRMPLLPLPSRSAAARERGSLAASSDGQLLLFRPSGGRGKRVTCMHPGTSEGRALLVTGANWKASVLGSKLPVLVEFFAAWCGPCRMVDRVVDELAEEYTGQVRCFKLNADHYPQVAMEHGVERVPTVLIFKNGQRMESITGTMPKAVYVGAIEKALT